MKILVRFPNWIGDCIFARGFLKGLEKKYPDAEIWILIKADLKNLVWDRKVITFRNYRDLFNLRKIIQSIGFEKSFIIPESFSSAFFNFFYRISDTYGFVKLWDIRNIFIKHKVKLGKERKKEHILKNYIRLFDNEGALYENCIPDFPLPEKKKNYPFEGTNYVVFAPFAGYGKAKVWPKEFYITLGKKLQKKGYEIYITGAKEDRKFYEKWEYKFQDAVGKIGLLDVAYLIKYSKLFIGNDTGLLHLSAALNVPSIGIYGSTYPVWTGPLSKNSFVFWKGLPCSPCFQRKCPLSTYECLLKISPLEVYEKALYFLDLKY